MAYLGRQTPWQGGKAEFLLKLLLISDFPFFFSPEPGCLSCLSNLDSVSASFL